MLTQEQIESFDREGYLVIQNVLSSQQVKDLRTFFEAEFKRKPSKRYGDDKGVRFDVYNRYPEVRWLLFHEPTIEIVKSLLGHDYLVLRESAAHSNGFVGWHKDTTSQEEAGEQFHWQDDFLMVEVAYYLQDNSEEYGGGLDVVPGSHRTPDPFLRKQGRPTRNPFVSLSRRAWQSFLYRTGRSAAQQRKDQEIENFVSLPLKAGDLLLFHLRLSHRATQPRQLEAARDKNKLAVFLICSRNNAHAESYHRFIYTRPDYVYLKDFSYDPQLLQDAKETGLKLV